MSSMENVLYGVAAVALFFVVRVGIRWLQQSKNSVLRLLGDIAYEEIEKVMQSNPGSEKMEAAIDFFREEMNRRGVKSSLSNQEIESIIQDSWRRSNQEKNTPQY